MNSKERERKNNTCHYSRLSLARAQTRREEIDLYINLSYNREKKKNVINKIRRSVRQITVRLFFIGLLIFQAGGEVVQLFTLFSEWLVEHKSRLKHASIKY